MAKKICAFCGKEMGVMSFKLELQDGFVCAACVAPVGITPMTNVKSFTIESMKAYVEEFSPLFQNFKATKTVDKLLQIDENSKTFKIGNELFLYSNLLDFELLEDEQTITKGGLGRAVAGGLLFGGVGAIVGGVTGGKKSKGICNSMKLRVTLKGAHFGDTKYIPIITSQTKVNSFIYKAAQDSAQKCISALSIILDEVNSHAEQPQVQVQVNEGVSAADELLKFKNLLDQGIITQEEFDAKKKQLLGL